MESILSRIVIYVDRFILLQKSFVITMRPCSVQILRSPIVPEIHQTLGSLPRRPANQLFTTVIANCTMLWSTYWHEISVLARVSPIAVRSQKVSASAD